MATQAQTGSSLRPFIFMIEDIILLHCDQRMLDKKLKLPTLEHLKVDRCRQGTQGPT